ncbi:type II toxin-antitoxin system VapB family antitoxin [Gordonia sp. TBRC 11910]|uniref:Type II toxin-antitoxin system VapB family antitoxin n=1 Tax=Gordonia asplenii TaxID=2725283 RepID=A0A848KQJ6_9ACTN|nr:type II toxin-antitoxin system VapB family antitoxin [Gordonia asplenii]NMO01274.1 type II toxin-antitoxin system VapB family antitoxin [Gordonia asplenii]
MIFKGVQDGKPYPDHRLSGRSWAKIPPRQFRLDQLTTVTSVLALDKLLSEDSTFYGDLFSHIIRWQGELYLEDGLHRAVRSALRNRHIIHARMLDLDMVDFRPGAPTIEEQVSGVEVPTPARPVGAQPRSMRATRSGWTLPEDM